MCFILVLPMISGNYLRKHIVKQLEWKLLNTEVTVTYVQQCCPIRFRPVRILFFYATHKISYLLLWKKAARKLIADENIKCTITQNSWVSRWLQIFIDACGTELVKNIVFKMILKWMIHFLFTNTQVSVFYSRPIKVIISQSNEKFPNWVLQNGRSH